ARRRMWSKASARSARRRRRAGSKSTKRSRASKARREFLLPQWEEQGTRTADAAAGSAMREFWVATGPLWLAGGGLRLSILAGPPGSLSLHAGSPPSG